MLREVRGGVRPGDLAARHAEKDVVVLKKRGLRGRHKFRLVDGRIRHRRSLRGLRKHGEEKEWFHRIRCTPHNARPTVATTVVPMNIPAYDNRRTDASARYASAASRA